MEQDKKKVAPATAVTPDSAKPQAAPVPAAAPVPTAEPVSTPSLPKPRFRLISRETKIGAVVAGSFLVVAGGVMGVKALLRETELPAETPVVMQPPQGLEAPPAPSTTRFAPIEAPPPGPMPIMVPEVKVDSSVHQARADLVIPEPQSVSVPAVVPPPIETPKNDLIIPPEPSLVVPPAPSDIPPVSVPAVKEPTIVPPPPASNDPFKANGPKPEKAEVPTLAQDPLKPEAKNPVIRISANEPKKDVPPPVEPPPPIDIAPPPEPKKEPAPKVDLPPLEPVDRKDPPISITPRMNDVPPIKMDTPAPEPMRIDLAPKKDNAPAFEQPRNEVKKDGEYDEDLHSLRQNESYRSLSKQYYNSEAYAVALQRYNHDHPGQADYVRIPPIWVLEKKYATDVSGGQARTVNFQQPAEAAVPRNEPVYTVADNGEMLAEIARRQLGSEDAWKKIWELNPQINPAKSIPGGTRLKMPGQ